MGAGEVCGVLYCSRWSQNELDSVGEGVRVEGEEERVDVENVAGDSRYDLSSDL
jgi:hypothetical protein